MNTYCEPDHVNFVKRNRVLLADILYDHKFILDVFHAKFDLPARETRTLVQLPFHPSLPPLPPSTLYIYILWRKRGTSPEPRSKEVATLVLPTPHNPESCLYLTHTKTKNTHHIIRNHDCLGGSVSSPDPPRSLCSTQSRRPRQ